MVVLKTNIFKSYTISTTSLKQLKSMSYFILNKHWVVFDKYGSPDYQSISCLRKDSIRMFLKQTSISWDEAKTYGYTCSKVTITFENVK